MIDCYSSTVGIFWRLLLHKLSHIYKDLIAPTIIIAFAPRYTYLQQVFLIVECVRLYDNHLI